MSDINSLNTAPTPSQTTTSTQRSSSVKVTRQTQRNSKSLTEITIRTTTNEVTEITKKRRALEAKIAELNNMLEENGASVAKFQIDNDDPSSVKFVDSSKGVTLEVSKTFINSIEELSENDNGLIMNTFA